MKRKALVLGLAAVLHASVYKLLTLRIVFFLDSDLSASMVRLATLAASFACAWWLARLVEGDDEPAPSLIVLLLFAAGYLLFNGLIGAFGIHPGGGSRFGSFLAKLAQWSHVACVVITLRLVRHRVMLFVGVVAIACQFHVAGGLGLLTFQVPKWALSLVTAGVALWIGWSFSFGSESPADRVRQPRVLWLFAAAGALTIPLLERRVLHGSVATFLLWSAFLVLLVLLADCIEPDDPAHVPSALGAGYGQLFMIFVALVLMVGGAFAIGGHLPYKWVALSGDVVGRWLPIVLPVAIAAFIMKWLDLDSRVRPEGPGRRALFWGVLIYFVGLLAGGSIYGVASNSARPFDFLGFMVLIAAFVAPLMAIAQVLMGIGLLRVLFHLDARPGHERA